MKFILEILFLTFFNITAQQSNTFEKRLFGHNNDIPQDVIELTDSSLVIIGQHFPEDYLSNKNTKVAAIVKLDGKGNFLWEKTFGKYPDARFSQVIQKDNHLYIVGTTKVDSANYLLDRIWLLKLDLNGNLKEEILLGTDSKGLKIFVQNNNLFVLGNTYLFENRQHTNVALDLIKLDLDLNIFYHKRIEEERTYFEPKLLSFKNDKIFIVGQKSIDGDKQYELFIKSLTYQYKELKTTVLYKSEKYFTYDASNSNNKINIALNIGDKKLGLYAYYITKANFTNKIIQLKNNIGINDLYIKPNGTNYLAGWSWGLNTNNLFIELDKNLILKKEKIFNDGKHSFCYLVKTIGLKDGKLLTIGYSNYEAKNENCNKWIVRKF